LALDCLQNCLQSSQLSRQELLDLVKDSKSTLSAAMQTLNDLLLFDKIESNMLQLEFSLVPCRWFFNECIRPFIRQLALSQIRLEVNLDSKLDGKVMDIDRHKLDQVIRNFISNAVKFTPIHGCITINAKVVPSTRPTSHDEGIKNNNVSEKKHYKVHFEVVDSGAGISEVCCCRP
jgi:signal transduction histidine kinase